MLEFIIDLAVDLLDIYANFKKESKIKTIIITIGCILIIALFVFMLLR